MEIARLEAGADTFSDDDEPLESNKQSSAPRPRNLGVLETLTQAGFRLPPSELRTTNNKQLALSSVILFLHVGKPEASHPDDVPRKQIELFGGTSNIVLQSFSKRPFRSPIGIWLSGTRISPTTRSPTRTLPIALLSKGLHARLSLRYAIHQRASMAPVFQYHSRTDLCITSRQPAAEVHHQYSCSGRTIYRCSLSRHYSRSSRTLLPEAKLRLPPSIHELLSSSRYTKTAEQPVIAMAAAIRESAAVLTFRRRLCERSSRRSGGAFLDRLDTAFGLFTGGSC